MSAIPHAAPHRLADAAREAVEDHADQYRPLGGYAILAAAFNAVFVAFLFAAGRSRRLPERSTT